jgi:type IV pilus assembly protein PilC
VHEKVLQGEEMHQAMAKTQLFPSRFLQLLAVAAETGTLHLILLNIADYYEQQFDQYIEQTTKLFEPVTVLILGVVIGALIIALYLPIFQLGNVV